MNDPRPDARAVLDYHGPPPRHKDDDYDRKAWEYLRDIAAMAVTAAALLLLLAVAGGMWSLR